MPNTVPPIRSNGGSTFLYTWHDDSKADAMISLQRLWEYYAYEIRRGHCGFGNYHLRDGLTADPVPELCVFPRESCLCPARTSCYHITAARLAVGLSDNATRRPLNLTQLRRKKQRRVDKTSTYFWVNTYITADTVCITSNSNANACTFCSSY